MFFDDGDNTVIDLDGIVKSLLIHSKISNLSENLLGRSSQHRHLLSYVNIAHGHNFSDSCTLLNIDWKIFGSRIKMCDFAVFVLADKKKVKIASCIYDFDEMIFG